MSTTFQLRELKGAATGHWRLDSAQGSSSPVSGLPVVSVQGGAALGQVQAPGGQTVLWAKLLGFGGVPDAATAPVRLVADEVPRGLPVPVTQEQVAEQIEEALAAAPVGPRRGVATSSDHPHANPYAGSLNTFGIEWNNGFSIASGTDQAFAGGSTSFYGLADGSGDDPVDDDVCTWAGPPSSTMVIKQAGWYRPQIETDLAAALTSPVSMSIYGDASGGYFDVPLVTTHAGMNITFCPPIYIAAGTVLSINFTTTTDSFEVEYGALLLAPMSTDFALP